MKYIMTFILVMSSCRLGAEMYQCENEKGRLSFSDKPCGDNAKTIEVKEPSTYGGNQSAAEWDAIVAANDLREYDREILKRQETVSRYRRVRDNELASLSRKKELSANNLAGANWEISLSQEMDVIQNKYRGLIESEEKEIAYLREQMEKLRSK